jgi:hypothetical protein
VNYSGSYRKLLGNSKSAILGAIEIYNKPNFEYRDEVFVVLLINGWELFLKAMLSYSKSSIYYKKRRGKPYRTLSLVDSFRSASTSTVWPTTIKHQAIGQNLEFLTTYRDNAVHFYNASGFSTLIYLLAQTAITNYHDMLQAVFGQDLNEKINWQLLPLGLNTPIDPVVYLGGARPKGDNGSFAVDEFLALLNEATKELERSGIDAGRLMTIYDVSLNSVKKITSADIIVGVHGEAGGAATVLVTKRLDPNRSHPHLQKDILEKLREVGHPGIGPYQFQAIVWKKDLKSDSRYCWVEEKTGLKKWSPDAISLIQGINVDELQTILDEYREFHLARNRQRKKATATPGKS